VLGYQFRTGRRSAALRVIARHAARNSTVNFGHAARILVRLESFLCVQLCIEGFGGSGTQRGGTCLETSDTRFDPSPGSPKRG
jgi:hypothetical protein